MEGILIKYKDHLDYHQKFIDDILDLKSSDSFPDRILYTSDLILKRIYNHQKEKKDFSNYSLNFSYHEKVSNSNNKIYSCSNFICESNNNNLNNKTLIFYFALNPNFPKPILFALDINNLISPKNSKNIFKE